MGCARRVGFGEVSIVDAVVIGAGHNGLVAGNLLADQGWSVVVLEANAEPGGAVRTAEVTEPGFHHDLFSAFYPLAAVSPVLRSLRLEAHGLRWRRAPLALAHPTPDGNCAVIGPGIDATVASLDDYQAGDGDGWRELYGLWERVHEPLIDALLRPFPPITAGARLGLALGRTDLPRFARLALLPVRRLAEEHFRGEGGALLLAGNALHADLTPETAGSAVFGWLLCSLAQQVGFPVPEGGAGQLTAALVSRLTAGGATLRCSTNVTAIEVTGNRAVAVRTAGGDVIRARRAILADVSAPALYLDLVGSQHLPPALLENLRHFQWDAATFKVDWALDGPAPWTAAPARRAGTIHLADSLDQLTQWAAELAMSLIPADPFLLFGQQSVADPTRSPPGTDTAWAYTHLPRRPKGDAGGSLTGTWTTGETESFVERIEDRIERSAPGFGKLIRARHVFSPAALEAENANLHGGAINGGTAQLHQQLIFRPVPGLARAGTPVRGLFLASSSAHPGGGVHGAAGANAARAALAADRRRSLTMSIPGRHRQR
jgi:phytoene dehydrogenase-like protein